MNPEEYAKGNYIYYSVDFLEQSEERKNSRMKTTLQRRDIGEKEGKNFKESGLRRELDRD